jgi:hypothetical protein
MPLLHPHVATIAVFDVAKIEVEFDPAHRMYHIRLIGENDLYTETTINVWRGAGGEELGAPELVMTTKEAAVEEAAGEGD